MRSSSTDLILNRLALIPSVGRSVGVFVTRSGVNAVVNIGDQTVTLPCVGFNPPTPGMPVQLERRAGQLVVIGPAAPAPPIGNITAVEAPNATVSAGGSSYIMPYLSSYTPVVGDSVVIDWAAGVIQGKLSTAPAEVGVPVSTVIHKGNLDPKRAIMAVDSGEWNGGQWITTNPKASTANSGAWWYGYRIKDYLAGCTVTKMQIYLPLLQESGVCNIGYHGYAYKSDFWVGLTGSTALSPRDGWVSLPLSFATYLKSNKGGISVTSGDGMNRWAGITEDTFSGALRFEGYR